MVALPISVSMPKYLSGETLIGASGVATGLIGGEFMGTMITTASRLTGTGARVASGVTKALVGAGAYTVAEKMTGGAKTFAGLASIGCLSSILLDVIHAVWPSPAATATRLALRAPRVARVTFAAPVAAPIVSPEMAPGVVRVD